MKKILFMLFILSASAIVNAQDDQFQKQVEEIMKAREEMLKSLMDDSSGGDLEKRMMDMMKRFGGSGMGSGNGFGFDMDEFDSPVVGEYDWIQTNTHKILKLKVQQIKDHPLDIKIEKGMIKIKGDVESTKGAGKNKVVRKSSFERSFSLPDDVDQANPEFENKNGEMLVKFKKLMAGTAAKKSKVAPEIKKQPERVPVTSDKEDISI